MKGASRDDKRKWANMAASAPLSTPLNKMRGHVPGRLVGEFPLPNSRLATLHRLRRKIANFIHIILHTQLCAGNMLGPDGIYTFAIIERVFVE